MSDKVKPPFIDKLEMVFDKILTEFAPLELKSLIEIPKVSEKTPTRHKVLSAGPGKQIYDQFVKMPVKPGDFIWTGQFGGSDILGDPYRVFRMDEILGIERE